MPPIFHQDPQDDPITLNILLSIISALYRRSPPSALLWPLLHANATQSTQLPSSFQPNSSMLPDAVSKIIDPLPHSIKIIIGVMLGLQGLAVVTWMVMMGKEISGKESKEKQS
eukprot:scaffold62042_cov73-Cyclotella_meneghiniana.AAC.2